MENQNIFESYNFTEQFINAIYSDIDYIFPLLNSTEKNYIKKIIVNIMKLIRGIIVSVTYSRTI